MVCIYILCIHSSSGAHLGCFHLLAFVKNAARITGMGNSLVGQWLELCTSVLPLGGAWGLIPGWGLKILQAMWYGATKRGEKNKKHVCKYLRWFFYFFEYIPRSGIARSYGNSTKFLRRHHFFSYNSFPAIVYKGSSSSHLYTSCFLIVAVFGYHLWRNVYANPLPILKSGSFWLLSCRSSLYILLINALSDMWLLSILNKVLRLAVVALSSSPRI